MVDALSTKRGEIVQDHLGVLYRVEGLGVQVDCLEVSEVVQDGPGMTWPNFPAQNLFRVEGPA